MRHGRMRRTVTTQEDQLPTSDLRSPSPPRTLPQDAVQWLWVAVPLLILLAQPLRWSVGVWFENESQLYYQAWVLVLAGLWAAALRPELARTTAELAQVFPDPQSPQRRGNLIFVVLGVVLFLISYLTMMPLFSLLALPVVLGGAVFFLFGPFLLRALAGPLLLLFLSAPLPSSLAGGIVQYIQLRSASFAGLALPTFGVTNRIQGITVTMSSNNEIFTVSPSYSGVGVFLFVLLVSFWWTRVHRVALVKTIVLILIAGGIGIFSNILRLLVTASLAANNSALFALCYPINAAPVIALDIALLFWIGRSLVTARLLGGSQRLVGPVWLGGEAA